MLDFNGPDALAGMPMGDPKPKRKTHRGGGRGKGKGGPGASHHNALNKAMASGDHATAKKHALNLANALHGHGKKMESDMLPTHDVPRSPAPSGATGQPSAMQAITPKSLPSPSNVPRMGGMTHDARSFLASALMRRK